MDTLHWKHRKTQKIYRIREFGINEEGLYPVVIYSPVDNPDSIWVRPCYEFFDGRFMAQAAALTSPEPRMKAFARGGPVTVRAEVPVMGSHGPEAILPDPQVARRDTMAVRPKET